MGRALGGKRKGLKGFKDYEMVKVCQGLNGFGEKKMGVGKLYGSRTHTEGRRVKKNRFLLGRGKITLKRLPLAKKKILIFLGETA